MLDEQVRNELLSTFQVELEEHCQALTHTFLQLEKGPPADEHAALLDSAFRAAHSLKGAARSVGLAPLEALAHGLEDVLGGARRGERALTPATFDLLYAAVDTLVGNDPELLTSAQSQTRVGASEADVENLLGQLQAEANGADKRVVAPYGLAEQGPEIEPRASASALVAPQSNGSAVSPAPRSSLRQPSGPLAHALPDGRSGPDETVRVPAMRLDALLEQLGELVVPRLQVGEAIAALQSLRSDVEIWQREWRKVRPRLREIEQHRHHALVATLLPIARFFERNETSLLALGAQLSELEARLASPAAQFGMLTADLQADVKRLRMLPFGSLAETLERTVRDLARSEGKEARLVLVGADTELDRRVLQAMKDPLLHLLRNAVGHGIEPARERRQRNKPVVGSVAVTATQRGATITVEVEDDGAGLDISAVRRAAHERGLMTEAELAAKNDAEVLQLIFLAGLSTRADVNELSGRGVGLDVVARNVERLGGRVDVAATPGQGTCFTVTLPLTLATTRALLVEAAGALYALPTTAVERVTRVYGTAHCGTAHDDARREDHQLRTLGGRPMLEWNGVPIPVAALAALLDTHQGPAPASSSTPLTLVVVHAGAQRVALIVDRVQAEDEIVVKPLGHPLLGVRHYGGATILGTGQVVPILNVGDLVRTAASHGAAAQAPIGVATPAPQASRHVRVLIADDSLTTRSLERYILEAAGYEVELAVDGAEAFARLKERPCDVLVSDVNMPQLDGIALTAKLRGEAGLQDLPVILVTSLDSSEDRERGLQAGADAYIVKSAFDQDQLLQTIRELV